MRIRLLDSADDIVALTALLHRAYAPLAVQGLRFSATHQTPEMTRERLEGATCFVLEDGGSVIGTILVKGPGAEAPIEWYREPTTWRFGQFGIEPGFKGRGLGRRLHEHAIDFAKHQGARSMALDTAAPATELIAMYGRWGYREIGRHRWHDTNYESVIMKKGIV